MRFSSIIEYFSIVFIGLAILASPKAKADEWNQKTILTFSGPVEVPGQVLPAGTYVFKIVDSQSDRDIVQIFNKDENHLYGTFLAIPDLRLKPTGKTVIRFEERQSGSPEAVKAWFYPGEDYGHEFVYPKVRAVELAKANHQPVASTSNETAANTKPATPAINQANMTAMKQAPLKAQKPSNEEVEITQVFPPPPHHQSSPPAAEQAYNNPPAPLPKVLPRTASQLPLYGLIGLLSLAGAGFLRYAAAKIR